jgi:hypothetical protein
MPAPNRGRRVHYDLATKNPAFVPRKIEIEFLFQTTRRERG